MIKALNQILSGKSLSRLEAFRVMGLLASGDVSQVQAGALLGGLRLKSESIDEIVGFAQLIRSLCVKIQAPERQNPLEYSKLIDVCGTGGDGLGTFNVSTAVAFVVACCNVKVAKHGNRSVSSKSGSFDVLEELKIKSANKDQDIWQQLDDFNVTFLFAPSFHPVLKKLSELRRNLGVFTVFNLLGPLLNPLEVKYQVIGVYNPDMLEKMAQACAALGSQEVMVVHGHDGLDEISVSGPTEIAHFKDGLVKRYTVRPEDFGLTLSSLSDLKGGNAHDNARIMRDIFDGEQGPKLDLILINAAAALIVGGEAEDFISGIDLARRVISEKKPLLLLEKMREVL